MVTPGGSASIAAIAAGTSAKRTGSESAAVTASSSAKKMNVRCVPISGISSSEAAKVPNSEPSVESAYRRPAVLPASSVEVTRSRIAHGATAPSTSTGTATSASTPNSEPAAAPTSMLSKASTEIDRNGCATSGISATMPAPTSTQRDSASIVGRRSATVPPTQ